MTAGSESWLSWVFKIFNFAVLVAILVKYAGKPLKNYLQKRSADVREKLDEADRLFKEADALKNEYQARLAKLDGEIEAFKKSVQEDTEKEKNKIIAEATEFARRIKEQASITYQQEIREMTSKIKAEIAKLTMERAEKLIVEKYNAKDDERMVDEFIQKLRSLN
jgi:F-type H+-transporting ATPase subunit b